VSWDLLLIDLPTEFALVEDIPSGFVAKPLGSRAEVAQKIAEVFPNTNFSDPVWPIIRGDDWAVEFHLGNEDPLAQLTLYLRGGTAALGAAAALVERLKVRAIDIQTTKFFDAGPDAQASFETWQRFRDQALGQK
jgi:hypothetical protein